MTKSTELERTVRDMILIARTGDLLQHPALGAARALVAEAEAPNASATTLERYRAAVAGADISDAIKTVLIGRTDHLLADAQRRQDRELANEIERVEYARAQRDRARARLHVDSDDDADRLRACVRNPNVSIDERFARRVEREVTRGMPVMSWLLAAFDERGIANVRGNWCPSANLPPRERLFSGCLISVWNELIGHGHHPQDFELALLAAPEAISDADAARLADGSVSMTERRALVGLPPIDDSFAGRLARAAAELDESRAPAPAFVPIADAVADADW